MGNSDDKGKKNGDDITIPAPGEHFGAGIPDEHKRTPRRRRTDFQDDDGDGEKKTGLAPSTYRLKSKSEVDFPEAYVPVDKELWEGLSPEQRKRAVRLQASAMERVGFEKGTPKFFIEDFDPSGAQPMRSESAPSDTDLVAMAAPRLVIGGMLIGAGIVTAVVGLAGLLEPLALVAGVGVAGGVFGGVMVSSARS